MKKIEYVVRWRIKRGRNQGKWRTSDCMSLVECQRTVKELRAEGTQAQVDIAESLGVRS